jgi:hypothetical protein
MGYSEKDTIVKAGDNLLLELNNDKVISLDILRKYNVWYSSVLDFCSIYNSSRLDELIEIHIDNQKLLQNPQIDIDQLSNNFTIQVAIVQGSPNPERLVF